MYVRTTTNSTMSSLLTQIMSSQSSMLESQVQLASGKKINAVSDDAIAASKLLQINSQQNDIKRYLSNIDTSNSQINTLDDVLSSVENVGQDAYALSVQAANGTYSDSNLKDIKSQIDQIIASVVDFANTDHQGQYIFSGNNTSTPTYTIGADGSIKYNGSTNTTSDNSRSIEIMDGVYISLNVNGQSTFGSYTPATSTDPAAGTGLLGALGKLSAALGKTPPDQTAIADSVDGIQAGIEKVSNIRTQYGASISARLDMSKSYLTDLNLSLKERSSNIEDLDYAEAMTNFTNKKYAYQAALQVTSKTLGISLLNYI